MNLEQHSIEKVLADTIEITRQTLSCLVELSENVNNKLDNFEKQLELQNRQQKQSIQLLSEFMTKQILD